MSSGSKGSSRRQDSRAGTKRRPQANNNDDDETPRIRIKRASEILEPPEISDYDPPTPPMPRRSQENGVRVKTEVEEPVETSEAANIFGGMGDGSPSTANQTTPPESPSVSNFFTFASTPQAKAPLPNAMTSEIKHKPVRLPMRAHYYSHAPEDELKYGGGDGNKIKTIPMHGKETEDSDDSEPEEQATKKSIEESKTYSRYFKSSTVFSKYDFKNRKVDTTRLAVFEKRAHIINSLKKTRVVIIHGFTGCGKTTQVPQYILDQCFQEKKVCNIVVTQPRKIAAVSVAKRVCYERNWTLGSVVGYQVGMESKTDKKDTVLTFMTTGVLLQKLISSKSLKDYTHIIIDEVHERDLESDFLLLVIKKIMAADTEGKERHVRLVLMSATFNTKKFEDYFVFDKDGEEIRPHVVKIPFVPRHRIDEFFLDDLLQTKMDQLDILAGNLDKEKAIIQEEIYDVAVSCIIGLDDVERKNNPDPRLQRSKDLPNKRGAVLVFLPGMEEIKRLQRALEKAKKEKITDPANERRTDYRWAVLPLHSSVTVEEQAKVFDPQGDNFRKIILSTNIAESSVTVPDVSYVIDFCLTKSLRVDESTNFTTLRMVWAAQNQCTQRKGRTGRVADGKVYRLVTKNFFHGLAEEIEPEMQRSNLETVILMCKKFDLESPLNLLSDALDKPKLSGIERAVLTLKELGALTVEMIDPKTKRPYYDIQDGDLTFVGKVMSDLPIPQQCTRLIMLGHCFGVMHEAIIIAAGLSVKNPFQTGFQKQLDTYLQKMKHANKSFSDLFALYNVYKLWISKFAESGEVSGSRKTNNEYRWAQGAMVHLAVLREIKSTVELIEERLKRLGITASYTLPVDQHANSAELSSEQGLFLKLAIAGAFYPHYFLRKRPLDQRQYERELNKHVNGSDVFRTIYFRGFPVGHKGQLYAKHVADYLACGLSIPSVRFDGQKVLSIFDTSTGDTIGPFSKGIFRAIKLRQLRTDMLEFRVLLPEDEQRELNLWMAEVNKRKCAPCPRLRSLPPVDTHKIKVRVQHVNSPSQFWVVVEPDFTKLTDLTKLIQDNLTPIPFPRNELFPNALCLAPFEGVYYRAKILRADNSNNPNARSLVHFIDYGNSQWVPSSCLYDFSPYLVEKGVPKAPCMAIECRLKGLKPNIVHGPHWSTESIELMNRFCSRATNLMFEIYSIHQSIMSGDLIGFGENASQKCSLNELMLSSKNGSGKLLGEKASESYLSMENHQRRRRANDMERDEKTTAGHEQIGDSLDLDFMNPPTNGKKTVTLKGPWSPLEMTFQACVKCGNTKEVRIENSSVNSVLLDHEPTASNSRMLVAAHVSITKNEDCMMIRDSTVMPAIPGFLALVAMVFAPRAELRVDRNQSKYTGIVCGCGTVTKLNGERCTVHPENDMEIVFDTEIDDEDVDRINIIRYNLNLILRNSRGVNKSEYHKRVREELIKLLKRQRKKIEEEIWPQEEHVWDRISEEFLQTSTALGMTFNHDDIFLPHHKVMLNKLEEEEVMWDGVY